MFCAEVLKRVLLGEQNFILPSCFISVVPVEFEETLLYCRHTSLPSEYFSYRFKVSADTVWGFLWYHKLCHKDRLV